jgi:hypothetical protein
MELVCISEESLALCKHSYAGGIEAALVRDMPGTLPRWLVAMIDFRWAETEAAYLTSATWMSFRPLSGNLP